MTAQRAAPRYSCQSDTVRDTGDTAYRALLD